MPNPGLELGRGQSCPSITPHSVKVQPENTGENSKKPQKAHFPLLPVDSSVYQPSITREETTRRFSDPSMLFYSVILQPFYVKMKENSVMTYVLTSFALLSFHLWDVSRPGLSSKVNCLYIRNAFIWTTKQLISFYRTLKVKEPEQLPDLIQGAWQQHTTTKVQLLFFWPRNSSTFRQQQVVVVPC